jgi:hypothetical protein
MPGGLHRLSLNAAHVPTARCLSRNEFGMTGLSTPAAPSSRSPMRMAPVSHFTGGVARIVYWAFMLRNIIPLVASLTALFSSLYMYTA